jgi:hypothetical protein
MEKVRAVAMNWLCKKAGLPYKYYKLDKTEHKQSVGFDVEKGWEWEDNEFKEMDMEM